tara:strand:- start:720 stop:1424 length:705 start_codon:yes stop_codon:yes gene_type:complete
MIKVNRKNEIGHADLGWLNTYHHFSFSSYFDPSRMGFGALRVVNDDLIKAGTGFSEHGHQDMEIITFVREGAVTHQDSVGNTGRTIAGDIQVMSAGTGIRHSEHNLEDRDTLIFQIWIKPKETGISPRWDSATFADKYADASLPLLVSGRNEDANKNVPYIHQEAAIFGGKMHSGSRLVHPIKDQAYLVLSRGKIEVGEHTIHSGDGVEITNANQVEILATNDSELIIIDVPSE